MGNKQARRYHRSREQWQALIARAESSGRSVEAFCRSESISTASFYHWRKRLSGDRSAMSALGKPPAAEPAFLDLGSLSGEAPWELELDLGAGVVLHLRRG